MGIDFTWNHVLRILETQGRPEGKEWDVVLIEAGESKNPTYYSAEVLKNAVPLFEGVKACAYFYGKPFENKEAFDHLPDDTQKVGGFSRNVVGFFKNARFGEFKRPDGSTGQGILASFHVLEGAGWLRANLRDAWEQGKADLLGFSIDAQGTAHDGVINGRPVKIVERITKVTSTDVVSEPAAGGSLLRLAASCQNHGGESMNVIEIIRAHRPEWLNGFAVPAPDADMNDYTLRVLESNLSRAEDVFFKMPNDEVEKLTSVSRGVKALEHIVEKLKSGKTDEAEKLLEAWLSKYSVKESDGQYGFPHRDAKDADMKKEEKPVGEQKPTLLESETATAQAEVDSARKQLAEAEAKCTSGEMKEKYVAAGKHLDEAVGQIKLNSSEAIVEAKKHIVEANAIIATLGDEEVEEKDELKPEEKEKMDAIETKEKELKAKESALLIKEKLLDSGLSPLSQARVSRMFSAKESVTAEELDMEIKNEKELVASFKEGKVAGLGAAHSEPKPEIKVGADKLDKIKLAFDGFFAGNGREINGVRPFSSLREAYGQITGRWNNNRKMAREVMQAIALALPSEMNSEDGIDMSEHLTALHESWNSNPRIPVSLRESITTSTFSVAFGDAMYRRLQKEYMEDPLSDWRKIVSGIENLADAHNKFHVTRIGEKGKLPVVAQNGPYQETTLEPTELDTYMTPVKYGDLLKLTWEDVLADRVNVLRRIPRIIARSVNRTIHFLVWDNIESNVTVGSDALIHANHANVIGSPSAIGYGNFVLGIGGLAEQVEQDSGYRMGLRPKYLLTSMNGDMMAKSIEICKSDVKVMDESNTTGAATLSQGQNATVANINKIYGVEPLATVGIGLTNTTKTHWYVCADPSDAEGIVVGFLGGRDQADIFVQGVDTPTQGSMFDSDSITFKTRLVFATTCVDWRWIQGSRV